MLTTQVHITQAILTKLLIKTNKFAVTSVKKKKVRDSNKGTNAK